MGPLNEQHLLNVIMVSRDADRRRYNLVIPENSKLQTPLHYIGGSPGVTARLSLFSARGQLHDGIGSYYEK